MDLKHRDTDSVHYVRVIDDEEIQMLVKLGGDWRSAARPRAFYVL